MWMDVKEYFILPYEVVPDMKLFCIAMGHGTVTANDTLVSQNYHGAPFKEVFGNFKIHLSARSNDPRPLPTVAVKALVCGKLVDFKEDTFFIEIATADYCPKASAAVSAAGSGGSVAKKFKIGATSPSTPPPSASKGKGPKK